MRFALYLRSCAVLFLLLRTSVIYGQVSARPAGARPRIGIALEGGGAKGLAHIGVLEWLEEHHIPIDYVAGTSMGGLIGGLYATGRSPQEIGQIVSDIDWDQALVGETPYRALSFRRKEDYRSFPNRLELGLRHGLTMPSGLSSGQSVRMIIDRYMLPYSEPKSFDDLPIPFRCVAANLVTGKAEVFSSGSVATALRATMSLPGVFAPVKEDDKIYVDGGVLNNLPTDVVKQMGADIVIGVHLNVGPTDPAKLRTMLAVTGSATGIMIDANVLRSMELADILLTIDVSGYSTLDFSRVEQIIPQGYKAAVAKSALLSRLAVEDGDWKRYITQRDSRRIKADPVIQFVEVEGIDKDLSPYVTRRLNHHRGTAVNAASLESELDALAGTGRYDTLTYSLTKKNNEVGLRVNANEKDYAPPFLKPGFVIDGADPDNVGFTFASRVTFLDIGGYRSELRTEFAIGSSYGIGAEYYRPFTPLGRWFFAPRVSASRTPLNIYSANTRLAEYRLNSLSGGLDVGYSFDRFRELRFGYETGHSSAERDIGSPLLPNVSGRRGTTRVRFALDRLDNPIIPRDGAALVSSAGWVDSNPGTADAFPSAETVMMGFKRLSKPGSIYAIAAGGSTFGNQQVGIPQFTLGGPARLSAYGLNEFLVNQYIYGRAGYLHELAVLPAFLGRGVYLNGHVEVAKVYGPTGQNHLPLDGALGVVTETLFGPLMIGGSIGGSGHKKWFFQLGKVF